MFSSRSFLLIAVSAVTWAQAGNDVPLTVFVLDAQRLPVQGIIVRVAASASSPALKEGAPDATGQFRTSLPVGSYAVSVNGNQFRPETRTVSLITGGEAALEMTVEPAQLSQSVTVTGSPDSYNVPVTSSATRTNTPLLDLPQSVQIISRKVIDDQQVFEFADAARYVSGVARANTSIVGAIGNELSIRGFELDPYHNYLRDGIKFPAFVVSDTANIEQIEILKGPASALYGRAEAGGVVNLVSKKPFEEPMFSLQFTGGNYDFYRPQFDISGPLNRSGTLLYRLNGAYENRGSFRDFVSGERYFAAPYLLWKLTERTSLSAFGEFLNEDRVSDYGIPPLNGRPAPVPVSTYYDEPFNNEADRERQIGYVFQHQFSPNWSLQNSYRASRTNARYLEVYNTSVLAGTTLVGRTADAFAFPQLFQYSQTNLAGTVKTGPVRHTVLVGLELGWESGSSRGPGVHAPPMDIFHPVYGQITSGAAAALLNNPAAPGRFVLGDEADNQITGGYAQDQFSLGRRVKVLAGARFERYAQDSINFIP